MGIIEDVEAWGFRVATRKITVMLVKGILGLLAGAVTQHYMNQFGITYDPVKMQEGLTILSLGAIEGLHDWAKLKYPNIVKI